MKLPVSICFIGLATTVVAATTTTSTTTTKRIPPWVANNCSTHEIARQACDKAYGANGACAPLVNGACACAKAETACARAHPCYETKVEDNWGNGPSMKANCEKGKFPRGAPVPANCKLECSESNTKGSNTKTAANTSKKLTSSNAASTGLAASTVVAVLALRAIQ